MNYAEISAELEYQGALESTRIEKEKLNKLVELFDAYNISKEDRADIIPTIDNYIFYKNKLKELKLDDTKTQKYNKKINTIKKNMEALADKITVPLFVEVPLPLAYFKDELRITLNGNIIATEIYEMFVGEKPSKVSKAHEEYDDYSCEQSEVSLIIVMMPNEDKALLVNDNALHRDDIRNAVIKYLNYKN